MKKITILVAALGLALAAAAQAPAASPMQWDTSGAPLGAEATIVIGDQLNVARYADFRAMQEYAQNGIVPLSQRMDTVADGKGRQQVRQLTVVTCFDPGTHRLGFGADSLTLRVEDYPGVDTAKADIKDIANILREPHTFWEVFRWVLLGMGLLALVALLLYAAKRRKQHKPLVALKPAMPPVPPGQRALAALEALRVQELWKQGRAKEYHTLLTDIVRRYLKERYGVDSTEMTTDETLSAFAASQGHTPQRADLLRQVLRAADMVKFAKAEPLPHEHERSLADAVDFVRTEPQPAPENAQPKTPLA